MTQKNQLLYSYVNQHDKIYIHNSMPRQKYANY